ncbi:MAG: amino acid ABC transporter permease [Erysipelotrichaceae bacterium]|nr:amino acid ABC transporter permease [Erysipelotrichaceae bacterium]MCI9312348.1 amino acid ABC transporter permease [Erysipelotrichaceae bacterium]
MRFSIERMLDWLPYILEGLGVIIGLSLICAIIGVIVGVLCAFLKKKKGIGMIISAYIDFFRGTPVFFQLYFFYFGLPGLIPGFPTNKWACAVIVFGLNSGAYLAEVMRAGIEGIDKGQIEAAKALGVSQKDIIKDIILNQAIRSVLPALFNEFIALTKETSVVSVLGVNDMMKRYSFVVAKTYSPIEPLVVIGIGYLCLNKVLSFIGQRLERKLAYD